MAVTHLSIFVERFCARVAREIGRGWRSYVFTDVCECHDCSKTIWGGGNKHYFGEEATKTILGGDNRDYFGEATTKTILGRR